MTSINPVLHTGVLWFGGWIGPTLELMSVFLPPLWRGSDFIPRQFLSNIKLTKW